MVAKPPIHFNPYMTLVTALQYTEVCQTKHIYTASTNNLNTTYKTLKIQMPTCIIYKVKKTKNPIKPIECLNTVCKIINVYSAKLRKVFRLDKYS